MVATGSVNERFVVLWDLSIPRHPVRLRELDLGGEPPPGINDFVVIPYWSENGRLVAAVDQGRDDQVTVFDVDSGRRLWSSPLLSRVGQVAFSPDGKTLAVASADRRRDTSQVTLWTIGEWDRPRSIVPHGSAGIGVEFLRGGEVLVTTSDVAGRTGLRDATASTGAQLWDAATLEPIGEPVLFGANGSIFVNRDAAGHTAVIGSGNGRAFAWNVDVQHWEDLACRIAGRNLTRAEWSEHLPHEPYRATCRRWPTGVIRQSSD
jgi:WD40 repeat protein